MLTKILDNNEQALLFDKLVTAFLTFEALRTWLQAYYAAGLPRLGAGNLEHELSNLITWAKAQDGMETLLQQLADHPPHGDTGLPPIIFALTVGEIKARAKTNNGLPDVPPHQRWFAADRPFVNREELRQHLQDLENSPPGARCILVIEGNARSGKTFAVSLARACQAPANLRPTIDMEKFALYGQQVNARDLAVLIVGDKDGCPEYDETKDSQAVPGLLYWISNRLTTRTLWVIIDHCNRKPLTQGASELLVEFAGTVRNGDLPNVRLILVDFDCEAFDPAWREDVRHDRAVLPDSATVKEWCRQLATAARRKYTEELAARWAGDVFASLDVLSHEDGTWHKELERRLRHAVDRILACEVQP